MSFIYGILIGLIIGTLFGIYRTLRSMKQRIHKRNEMFFEKMYKKYLRD